MNESIDLKVLESFRLIEEKIETAH